MSDGDANEPTERKVIDGSVAASSEPAKVEVNQGIRYTVREIVHHRITVDPTSGEEVGRDTLVEFAVTSGEPPEPCTLFQGLGNLQVTLPAQTPGGTSPVHHEPYRFHVIGGTLEEAWRNFDDSARRGAAAATDDFKARWTAHQEEARKKQLLDAVSHAPGILRPGASPFRS